MEKVNLVGQMENIVLEFGKMVFKKTFNFLVVKEK